MKRVNFYFDGFNFYNGLKAISLTHKHENWKRFYWINFVSFCNQFIPQDQILNKVKYFTAPPLDENKRSRQAALLEANKLLNPYNFEVIKGKYIKKNVTCKVCNSVFQQPEEKRTDVNISLHLIQDCYKDIVDKVVLISADSDLAETVKTIKSEFPSKEIKIYFPPLRSSSDLLSIAKKVVFLENNYKKFEAAIMSHTVTNGIRNYTIPASWIVC